jgi:hypothetical protein
MLCYAMLCYAVLCCAMLCYAVLCYGSNQPYLQVDLLDYCVCVCMYADNDRGRNITTVLGGDINKQSLGGRFP